MSGKSQMIEARPSTSGSSTSVAGAGTSRMSPTSPRHPPQSQPTATPPPTSTPKQVSATAAPDRSTDPSFEGARYLPSTRPSWLVACSRTDEIACSSSQRSTGAASAICRRSPVAEREPGPGQHRQLGERAPDVDPALEGGVDQRGPAGEHGTELIGCAVDLVGTGVPGAVAALLPALGVDHAECGGRDRHIFELRPEPLAGVGPRNAGAVEQRPQPLREARMLGLSGEGGHAALDPVE